MTEKNFSPSAIKKMARHVLDVEHKALELSRKSIDENFLKAVEVIAKSNAASSLSVLAKAG